MSDPNATTREQLVTHNEELQADHGRMREEDRYTASRGAEIFLLDPTKPADGEYRIVRADDGWRWEFHDRFPISSEDFGTVMDSRDEALEDAINNAIYTVDESLLGVIDRLQSAKSN